MSTLVIRVGHVLAEPECFRCGKPIARLKLWIFGFFPICDCCWGDSYQWALDHRPSGRCIRPLSALAVEVAVWLGGRP